MSRLLDTQILVVDDEPDLRTLYELTLLREGYRVEAAGTVQEASQLLATRKFDVVITDMRLPDGLGMELLRSLKSAQRAERCVVITAYGSAENAVESLKAGAFDYLTKPVDLKQFRTVIASAVQDGGERAVAAAPASADPQPAGLAALTRMVGDSAVMRTVKERIAKVARSMAPVLVHGESGTGKELAALALHANSHRAAGPLVAVNCSAIPESLLEAEFFGARKGSYTGATQDRMGFFQTAQGGTLFLDEIGDLPLSMQSKLLRAIQERCVRPLGAAQEEPVDVRIVSATHKDLGAEVRAGRFRQDLYYRLNVIDIHIPALRQRREDLPALCEALLARIAQESGQPVPNITAEQVALLADNPLTGNVRELENLLHRAVALAEGAELKIECQLPAGDAAVPGSTTAAAAEPALAVAASTPGVPALASPTEAGALQIPSDLQSHLDQQEREILVAVLRETGFNRTAAAARLGLSLRQIRYRIARLNIEMPGGAEPGEDSALSPLGPA